MEIHFERNTNPKKKPDQKNLGFGKYFTDHMFIMDYTEGRGWHDARIIPYAPLELDPATMFLHYGQGMFEGMKAYKTRDGRILLFRPDMNMKRANKSNDRLCIPELDVPFCVEAISRLVSVDSDWIPTEEGTSLYIRPFIIATDVQLGVHPSHTYKFIVILSPVGSYYPEGINPVKIFVENEYVRAVKGGIGFSKTAGNYAASIKAQMVAQDKGYTQVLWLDGVHRKYVEEVGTMNVFFKVDGKILTPDLQGSILAGVTRDSAIRLLESWGYEVCQRRIDIQELYDAKAEGKLEEAFGTGTAAVISPIGELNWDGNIISINDGKTGPVSEKLYNTMTGIQNGIIEDNFGWTYEVI